MPGWLKVIVALIEVSIFTGTVEWNEWNGGMSP